MEWSTKAMFVTNQSKEEEKTIEAVLTLGPHFSSRRRTKDDDTSPGVIHVNRVNGSKLLTQINMSVICAQNCQQYLSFKV